MMEHFSVENPLADVIARVKASGMQVVEQDEMEFVVMTMSEYRRLLQPIYSDLDNLSGTWTTQQGNEFLSILSDFSHIDEELWR